MAKFNINKPIVKVLLLKGEKGDKGIDGKNGKDGKDGKDGVTSWGSISGDITAQTDLQEALSGAVEGTPITNAEIDAICAS